MACNRIIMGALAIVTGQVRQDIRTRGLIVGILGDFLKSSGSSILARSRCENLGNHKQEQYGGDVSDPRVSAQLDYRLHCYFVLLHTAMTNIS